MDHKLVIYFLKHVWKILHVICLKYFHYLKQDLEVCTLTRLAIELDLCHAYSDTSTYEARGSAVFRVSLLVSWAAGPIFGCTTRRLIRTRSRCRRHLDCFQLLLSPLFGYLLCFSYINKIVSTNGAPNMKSSYSGAGKKRK
jgi:hypothetical protein